MQISEADVCIIDKSMLHKTYEQWPSHFEKASEIKTKLDHDSGYYKLVIMGGMGGSGTSSDMLNEMMLSSDTPSLVVKNERLPSFVDKNSLVIINSISGNTVESLSMLEDASRKGAEVICISAGGKLMDTATKLGHKHILIPNLGLPRASLPYLLMPGLYILRPFLDSDNIEVEAAMLPKLLRRVSNAICASNPFDLNISKKIALFLEEGFTFCYSSPQLLAAGTRFKHSLNENAKTHCLRESILEASHNEIVPYTYNNHLNAKVLLLPWVQDGPLVVERFKKIKSLFKSIGTPMVELKAEENTPLSAMISTIYKLDYATIYMATLRKVDPSPTPAIDILKKI